MPELDTRVFINPGELVKNNDDRLLVLNCGLRAAGVSFEARQDLLLGQCSGRVTTQYSAAELANLIAVRKPGVRAGSSRRSGWTCPGNAALRMAGSTPETRPAARAHR